MSQPVVVAIFIAAMVALIVGVDFTFFRDQPWARLAVNAGIVLVFAAFYIIFMRGHWDGAWNPERDDPLGNSVTFLLCQQPKFASSNLMATKNPNEPNLFVAGLQAFHSL